MAITLAVGVIACSMIIAAIGLPLLLRNGSPDERETAHELRLARIAVAEAAIRAIVATQGATDSAYEHTLTATYRDQLFDLQNEVANDRKVWQSIHIEALHAERAELQRLRLKGALDDVLARRLLGELDLIEAAYVSRPFRLRSEAASPSEPSDT